MPDYYGMEHERVEVDTDVIQQVTDDLRNALCDLLSNGPNEEDAKRVKHEIASIESIFESLSPNGDKRVFSKNMLDARSQLINMGEGLPLFSRELDRMMRTTNEWGLMVKNIADLLSD